MAPLTYVMALSLAVACYNASAEVRGVDVTPHPCSPPRGPAAQPLLHTQAPRHLHWSPALGSRHAPPALPMSCFRINIRDCCFYWQAGYLPVFPELKLATNAPFGLTSFALSLLLVFR